jgi:hypothetical protein
VATPEARLFLKSRASCVIRFNHCKLQIAICKSAIEDGLFSDLQFAIPNLQSSSLSESSSTVDESPRASGALVSLCFWLSLLVAGGLFAAATLSAKLLETEQHAAQLADQSSRVEQLALDVHRLELEAKALETDPDYLAAVARRKLAGESGSTSQPAQGADAPRSPVDPGAFRPASTLDPRLEPLRPWMIRIARCELLRARLLTIAAALVLFAFTFLHERPARVAAE